MISHVLLKECFQKLSQHPLVQIFALSDGIQFKHGFTCSSLLMNLRLFSSPALMGCSSVALSTDPSQECDACFQLRWLSSMSYFRWTSPRLSSHQPGAAWCCCASSWSFFASFSSASLSFACFAFTAFFLGCVCFWDWSWPSLWPLLGSFLLGHLGNIV